MKSKEIIFTKKPYFWGILVDMSGASASGHISVWKRNLSGYSDTISLGINIKPLPPKPLITLSGNVLLSSATDGKQWYDINGAIPGETQQSFTPSANGLYYVIVTIDGCSSEPSDVFILNTGIEERDKTGFSLKPNPANDETVVDFGGILESKLEISIFSAGGELIMSITAYAGSKDAVIDFSGFSSGVYYIRLSNSKVSHLIKISVVR